MMAGFGPGEYSGPTHATVFVRRGGPVPIVGAVGVRSYVGLGGEAGRAATVMLFPVLTPGGAHATRSDPPIVWQRRPETGSYIIRGLRAGQSRVESGMHHRLRPAPAGADERRARPRGPGDRVLTGAAALRVARRRRRAHLLRSRAPWLL